MADVRDVVHAIQVVVALQEDVVRRDGTTRDLAARPEGELAVRGAVDADRRVLAAGLVDEHVPAAIGGSDGGQPLGHVARGWRQRCRPGPALAVLAVHPPDNVPDLAAAVARWSVGLTPGSDQVAMRTGGQAEHAHPVEAAVRVERAVLGDDPWIAERRAAVF